MTLNKETASIEDKAQRPIFGILFALLSALGYAFVGIACRKLQQVHYSVVGFYIPFGGSVIMMLVLTYQWLTDSFLPGQSFVL